MNKREKISQEDKLKAIIDKSIKRGFNFQQIDRRLIQITEFKIMDKHDIEVAGMFFSPFEVLFSHEWAKSYYGTKEKEIWTLDFPQYSHAGLDGDYLLECLPAWQFHLKQQSIAENVIDYVWEHMND